MRKELVCPRILKDGIIIGYGGNQEWFPGKFQHLIGCGSVTGSNMAAIYAAMDPSMTALYNPKGDAWEYEEYLQLMQTMYQYMKLGFIGYPLIRRFAKGFCKYAKERGIVLKDQRLFLTKEKEESLNFILESIDHDHPVAFLILRHPAKEFRKDNWHWMTITGYDEEKHQLIWSNCGEREEIDWNILFDPNLKYYIGMVCFKRV